MNERYRARAIKTLDGMAEIIRNERLVRGDYATGVDDPKLAGAACQGRRYCLLGSAWSAYGAALIPLGGKHWQFEGVMEHEREEYLRRRPALRAVYDALNRAAQRKVKRNPEIVNTITGEDDDPYAVWLSPAEGLFETSKVGRKDLLRLVASARREVEKA